MKWFESCFTWTGIFLGDGLSPEKRSTTGPGTGYVGMWLEHLRSGYHPRCHQFLKSFYIEYGISVMQLIPNVVKWISRFLGCCYKSGYFPTLKHFHHIFRLIYSNNFPMDELIFRVEDCGYTSKAAKPVVMLPSLKKWNGEFIFLKGLDIEFMSLFKKSVTDESF